jgi:hypothetical protein
MCIKSMWITPGIGISNEILLGKNNLPSEVNIVCFTTVKQTVIGVNNYNNNYDKISFTL